MNVLILSATKGNNLKLSNRVGETLNEMNISNEVISLEDIDLPLYTPTEEAKGIPAPATELARKVIEAKVLVWSAPEYNGTIPPIVNNAVCWISRSGDDWREAFNGKFSVVATHSGGGGLKLCQAMRSMLEHVGSVVHPRIILTNYGKEFNPDSAKDIFQSIKEFLS